MLKSYSPSQWAKEVLSKSLNGHFKKKRGPKKPRLSPMSAAYLVWYEEVIEGRNLTDAVDVSAHGLKVSTREIWRKLKACELRDLERVSTVIKGSSNEDLLTLRHDLLSKHLENSSSPF